MTGVGQRAWLSESGKTLFVDIAVEGGEVRAWFWDFAPADLTRFIDARVRLLGNAGPLYNQSRQVRGVSLFAGRAADAVVETGAPEPWSLPVCAISSLYTHQAMDKLDRRVRLRGTVTATRVGQPTLVEDITMHSRSRDVRHRILRPRREQRGADRDGTGVAARNRGAGAEGGDPPTADATPLSLSPYPFRHTSDDRLTGALGAVHPLAARLLTADTPRTTNGG